MVEEGFKTLAHKVIENWRNEQTPLNAGVTEDELLAFEERFTLTLPTDFRYFYSLVNGMPNYEADKYFFSLWPLDRIATEVEREKALFEMREEETSGEPKGNSLCSAISSLFHCFSATKKEPYQIERIRQPLAFCKIEIPFGDVRIDSYRYLLCQSKEGRFFVHLEGGERLSNNFGHFLQRYLTETDKLYLWV